MKKKTDYIHHELRSLIGGDGHTTLRTTTNVSTGETKIVLEHTIIERLPIQDLEKMEDLYERLTCGSGRKVWQLEELAHPYNPND